jgi:methyltransferase (TIGR00027 family)
MAAAFLRALHPVIDAPPPVFDDPLVRHFLPDYQKRFLDRLSALGPRWQRLFRQRRSALGSMRAQIVVRARYADDALADMRAAGEVCRHLVLAAGLDTAAWREAPLPVVEVDHPATQRWKRETLRRRNQPLPETLRFLPVDFESQRLEDVLDAPGSAQFVTWLGTTYYLSSDAIAGTLAVLAASSAPGSRLVLDFWEEAPPGSQDGVLLWGTRVATALQFEPMRTFLTPAALAGLAADAGWRVIEMVDAAEQNRRYLEGRDDGLAVPGFAHLALLERPA